MSSSLDTAVRNNYKETIHIMQGSVELELKFQAPAPASGSNFFWLRLQHLKVLGSSSRTIWSIEN